MSDPTNPEGAKPENENPKPEENQDDLPEGVGDKGKAAIIALRKEKKDAEKLAADQLKELETLRREKVDAATAKALADEEEAKESGKFRELAEARAEKLKAATEDAESKAKLLERAEKRLKSVVDAQVERLKATKNEALIAGFPTDASLLDQAEWLDDPRTVAAIEAATEDKKVTDAQGKPKVPKTPNANGTHKESDEEARATQARAYRDW